jgi:iron complex transport system ATP-binding protein
VGLKLNIENVSFSYDGKNKIFENASFHVRKGDIFSLLGSNGAGKSTLIKCINRLLKIEEGHISINNQDIKSMGRNEIAKTIGYIPQMHKSTFQFRVLEVVLMGRTTHIGLLSSPGKEDIKIAEDALKKFGIYNLRDKSFNEISGGERQLVLFARVLAQQPSVLLLDEPTSHLDFGNQIKVLEVIEQMAKNGLSIIMTSHFPDHAFLVSNKVAIMKNGSLIDVGVPNDVITNENMRAVYGIDVEVTYLGGNINRKICVPLTKNKDVDKA